MITASKMFRKGIGIESRRCSCRRGKGGICEGAFVFVFSCQVRALISKVFLTFVSCFLLLELSPIGTPTILLGIPLPNEKVLMMPLFQSGVQELKKLGVYEGVTLKEDS